MNYKTYLLILLLFISIVLYIFVFRSGHEPFTVYQLNYKTQLQPAWPNTTGLQVGYNRCICSSDGECRCLDDNQLNTRWEYPDLYFNLDPPHYL